MEKDILFAYEKFRCVFGWKKIRKAILKMPLKDRNFKGSEVIHKRIQRLMKKLGIRRKVYKIQIMRNKISLCKNKRSWYKSKS